MAIDDGDVWKYYRYEPSMPAAIIFIVLFFVSTIFHLYQLFQTRTWYFIPLVLGGFFEWVGYIGRALSSKETPDWTLGPYIIQNLLMLVAPALFAASVYMELGRIVQIADGEAHILIKRRWLTKLFVAGDVLSFMLQGSGGGIMSSGSLDSLRLGEKIVIIGLFVQIAFFGLFVVVAGLFHWTIYKSPTAESLSSSNPWRKHLNTLYLASVFIMIRSIFRAVEYIQGNDGYILRHEVFLYVFDGVLMLAVMVIFNFVHPSEVKAILRGGKYSKGLKLHDYSNYSHRGDTSNYVLSEE